MSDPLHVLVVDDDVEIRELLADYLQRFGWSVTVAADAPSLDTALESHRYDVMVLDLMLPGEDGLSVCRRIRSKSSMPIVMLTARGGVMDRIVGLELGADDYVPKPFEPRELVARIQAVLRRTQAPRGEYSEPDADVLCFEGWQINRHLRQLMSPARLLVPLSNAEFRLLWAFIERPRQILTRDQLLDAARGRSAEAFDRSIDLLVSRLRQKLADDPKEPKLIKTVRGEGYIFDTKVQR
ncbi:response regulator [Chitinimonas sp.]|uniref:response regulator n=1 Tax=Chitinimonas sp. TaxID=1934313 RepID=UPI0035B1DFF2